MKKKVTQGLGTKKIKVIEEDFWSVSKIWKMEEEEKFLTRNELNEILKTQKVLTGRVFYSRIFENPRMVELVMYVRH